MDRDGRGVAMKKEGHVTVLGAREIVPNSAAVVIGSPGGSVMWLRLYVPGMKATVSVSPRSSGRFARGREGALR
jgi:hypothetical protein